MNRPRAVRAWRAACLIAAAGGVACTPIPSTSDWTSPQNACPAFPCAAYSSSSAATCQQGACVVNASSASTSGLILVVAVPTDALYAPGRTFAVTLGTLLTSTAPDGCIASDCCVPSCAPLPGIETVSRAYLVTPDLQSSAGVNDELGNMGQNTALPVQATYQPLWPDASSPYATSLGLPLAPIPAFAIQSSLIPGPGGGPSIFVQTYLQDGMNYQLINQPDPPFSSAYPPEIAPFSPTGTGPVDIPIAATTFSQFDLTTETGTNGPTIPTFDISRAAGLDGWTAYLRDATNLNTISNVVTLSGTESPHVELATNRFPGLKTDALTNAELVIAPPADGSVVAPTEILAPAGEELPAVEQYPVMPDPVTVTGEVISSAGFAPADLLFEATNVLVGGVETMSNFTFTARVSTAVDPVTGRSMFSVQLPPGQYLVVARPSSGSPPSSAVTLASLVVPELGPLAAPAVALAATQQLKGRVVAADTRPVSQATIEAVPTACAALPSAVFASPFLTTIECLPRVVQTTTGTDGSFSLALDPGTYLLRARPADGTRFPWVMRSVSITSEAVTLDPMVVPVPVSMGLRLVDPSDNPVIQAVVSLYSLPETGQAIELGSALTDDNGQYEMFVALP